MLKYLRHKETAKKIFIFLALIIIPAFVLWGVGGVGRDKSGPSYAGILFGKKISLGEYEESLRAVKNEAILRYPNFSDISEEIDLKSQAWDRLILLKEAEKEGIRVTDIEVISTIQSFPFLLRNGKFDTALYERLLENVFRTSPREYEEDMRDSLKISKLADNITKSVKASDEDLLKKYKEENEKIKVSYILMPLKDFSDKTEASEEEIETYYNTRSREFMTPERVNIEYIEFSYSDYLDGIEINEASLRQYYEIHKKDFEHAESVHARHILLKDEHEAKLILKRLNRGLDFQKAAKEYSEDPGSKENGGDLGYFEKGRMAPDFEEAAFAMEPGKTSDIVKTQFGYHIIKVEDKKPAYTEDFEDAKEKIKSILTAERAKAKAYTEAFRAKSAIEEGSEFEKTAKEYKKPLKKTGYFSKDGIIPGIGWNPALVKAAFNLKKDEVGPLISRDNTKSDTNYIIRLCDKKEPGIPPLSEVKKSIADKIKSEKTKKFAKESMEKENTVIKEKMENGASFEDAALSLGFTAKLSEYITRADYIKDLGPASEVKEVFDYNIGDISGVIMVPGGAAIMQLSDLKPIDKEKFEEIKEDFKKQYLELKKSQALEAWFANLKTKAGLVSNY